MSAGLNYVGPTPANSTDVVSGATTNSLIAAFSPNETSVQAQLTALVDNASNPNSYASLNYVNNQHALYTSPAAVASAIALLVPISTVSQPFGVASLDPSGYVPLAQMPNMGEGYLIGPWGPIDAPQGSTGSTPLLIGDWNIGVANMQFRPLMFLLAYVYPSVIGAQPVIEVRIANTTSSPAYAEAGTLVGSALGRYGYNDYHTVAMLPSPDTVAETPTLLGTNYNVWLTAWLYDLNGDSSTQSVTMGTLASGAAYLLRGVQ